MTNQPKVSIIITNYNYWQYLEDAIKSAKDQTYENIEIIVVDDGSDKGEYHSFYVNNYEEKIKWVYQTNRGLPSARNTGLMNATGDYVLFLDADDMIMPMYIEEAVNAAVKEKVDVVYCDMQHFGDRDDPVKMHDVVTKEMFAKYNPLAYCSMIKKSAVISVGGYNIKMIHGWEDYELWIELFEKGFKFTHIPYYFFMYRRHGTSMIDTSFKPEAVEYSQGILKKLHPNIYV